MSKSTPKTSSKFTLVTLENRVDNTSSWGDWAELREASSLGIYWAGVLNRKDVHIVHYCLNYQSKLQLCTLPWVGFYRMHEKCKHCGKETPKDLITTIKLIKNVDS